MEEWYCFKCKEKMVETDVSYEYLWVVRRARGLQCPKCKTAYIEEKTIKEALERMWQSGDIKT